MRLKVEKRLSSELLSYIGFFLFSIAAVLGDLISAVVSGKIAVILYIAAVTLFLISCMKNGILRINYKAVKIMLLWLLFIIIFVVVYNQNNAQGRYMTTFNWLIKVSMIFIIPLCPEKCYYRFLNILLMITSVNVAFTLFFFVFRDKYGIMKRIWGEWPEGTSNGMVGYHAGIDNHYSQNALIIQMFLFICISILFTNKDKFVTYVYSLSLAIISLFALILTNKRAHLLFGFIAVMFAYFVYKPQNRLKNIIKLTVAVVISISLFVLLANYIPAVNDLYLRFTTIGDDSESQTRFVFWKLCIDNFKEHPVLGIGWGGFLYEYHKHLWTPEASATRYYMYAHNVYFQLLCETGIIGMLMFLCSSAKVIFQTVNLLRMNMVKENCKLAVSVFSIMVQVFFYFYALTGNCLYDRTLNFWVIAVGMSVGMIVQSETGLWKCIQQSLHIKS